MFSPLDPAADAPRSTGLRAALKRSADRALAFVTLEGYDTDDVRERLHPRASTEAETPTPDLMTALRTPRLSLDAPAASGTAGQLARVRPTDPHRRAGAAASAPARRTAGASRRPTAPAAPAACSTPVAPTGRRAQRA